MLRKSPGFTLVELLIVISILGILAALILANLSGARERARDTQRKNDLRQLKTALRLYYNDFGQYPPHGDQNRISHNGTNFNWGGAFEISGNVYMSKLVKDPLSTATYTYSYWQDATDTDIFCAWANLENVSDEQIVESQSRCDSVCPSLYDDESAFLICSE